MIFFLKLNSSRKEALLCVFEDNEAVIKMIIKGRCPTMRHVSRTHRVALDWLFDRINLDPKIQIKYIDTKNKLADILTPGNFTRDKWNYLLCFFNISHFSSMNSVKAMSKKNTRRCRCRKSHSNIKADDEFGITIPREGSERACLDCSGKPGANQIWKSECTSELVKCAANRYGETRNAGQFIKLLRMEQWRQVVFSSEEIWWNVEHKYGETRIWQVCHRWWYGLWHGRRIGPFSKIPFILEQSEWSIGKDVGPFSRRCNARHW